MAINDVNLKVTVDKTELNKLSNDVKGIENKKIKVDIDTSSATSGLGSLGTTIAGVAGGMGLLDVATKALTLAWDGLKTSISLAAELETNTVMLEVMTGSAEKANTLLEDLRKMGAETPYETQDLIEATTVLINFGSTVDEAEASLKLLGDVAAGDKDKLQRLTLVFGQIQSTGRLMGGDLIQLINAGFNPLQEISIKTGKSMAVLKDEMSKGRISFKDVEEAFKSATEEGGKFHDMMIKQSETTSGKFSTMIDNIKSVAVGIGSVFLEPLKSVMDMVNDMYSVGKDAWKGLEDTTKSMFLTVMAYVNPITALYSTMKSILNISKDAPKEPEKDAVKSVDDFTKTVNIVKNEGIGSKDKIKNEQELNKAKRRLQTEYNDVLEDTNVLTDDQINKAKILLQTQEKYNEALQNVNKYKSLYDDPNKLKKWVDEVIDLNNTTVNKMNTITVAKNTNKITESEFNRQMDMLKPEYAAYQNIIITVNKGRINEYISNLYAESKKILDNLPTGKLVKVEKTPEQIAEEQRLRDKKIADAANLDKIKSESALKIMYEEILSNIKESLATEEFNLLLEYSNNYLNVELELIDKIQNAKSVEEANKFIKEKENINKISDLYKKEIDDRIKLSTNMNNEEFKDKVKLANKEFDEYIQKWDDLNEYRRTNNVNADNTSRNKVSTPSVMDFITGSDIVEQKTKEKDAIIAIDKELNTAIDSERRKDLEKQRQYHQEKLNLANNEFDERIKVMRNYQSAADFIANSGAALGDALNAKDKRKADEEYNRSKDRLDLDHKEALSKAKTNKQREKADKDYNTKMEVLDNEQKEKNKQKYKDLYMMQRAASISNAIINTYEAANKAFNLGGGVPFGSVLMGLTIAAGMANVAAIVETPLPGFATGGLVPANTKAIQINERGQEFVMNANATRQNLPILQSMNSGGNEMSEIKSLLTTYLQNPVSPTLIVSPTDSKKMVNIGTAKISRGRR